MKHQVFIALFILLAAACAPAATSASPVNPVDAAGTALAAAWTNVALTQTALPTLTPAPPSTSTEEVFLISPTNLPAPTPTVPSPYEADHEAIRKAIASYFDTLYAMRNTFRVDGLGDTVSTGDEAKGFRQTRLREQALEIAWARMYLSRYASYTVTLDYSEIVVFDGGQRARANFTEGNAIVYEISIPSGLVSHMSGVDHIMILGKEPDGWKIIYDVREDYVTHRSLYAPTPFPQDVLRQIDKRLMELSKGQAAPALPAQGKVFIPSDPAQLERWKEVETALAERLLPEYPRDEVLCEWELTDKSERKLIVWAICMATVTFAGTGNYYFPAASLPALIHLDDEGGVESVEIPRYGEDYLSDYRKLFPEGAWKNLPDAIAMEKHLHWRRRNPTEPPLVVLNVTAILTPTASPTP